MPLDPELDPHFEEAARLNNLDPNWLRALALGESSGRAGVTSEKNAGGLMQIIPSTAKQYGVADPYDPVQAIYGGARILNDAMTKAEELKAAGRDINPADHALRMYFGGNEGLGWGEKTAAYPGKIARIYRELQGGAEPAPPPVSPIDALAAAKYAVIPAPGAASAKNFTAPAGAPDTLEPAPAAVAALAALSGQGTAPAPRVQMASASPQSSGLDAQGRIMGGVNAGVVADPVLRDQGAPAGPQVAQGVPSEIDDLVTQTLALRPQAASPQTAAPSAAATPAAAAGQTLNPAYIREKQKQAVIDAALGVPTPAFVIDATRSGEGLPLNPETQARMKAAEARGEKQQVLGPGGVIQPAPGSVESGATAAGAKTEAEQQAIRRTQAEKPVEQRGAGSSVTYPPGSTGAQPWIDAQKKGQPPPPGVRINNGNYQVDVARAML